MALIPPFFLDCVVAIGSTDQNGQRKWVASGFLYGRFIAEKEGGEGKRYRTYLVTNRHVFDGLSTAWLRFNPQGLEPARELSYSLVDPDGGRLWVAHPDAEIDVAVARMNVNFLTDQGLQVNVFRSDEHAAAAENMSELGITEGDHGYVLGFPMGFVGEGRNAVIVRSGSIARIRDLLTGANKTFLFDAFIFPGNSGGPVILRPEATGINGTESLKKALLIGIVRSWVPYRDIAVSMQTNRPRVVFEENSGLAEAHPVNCIDETIQPDLDQLSESEGESNVEGG